MDWSQVGGALYGITHGRDGTHAAFPDLVSAADDDAIADEMHRITKDTNLGWPYTYYDAVRKIRLIGPEYGGDNKTGADGSVYDAPAVAFAPSAKRRWIWFSTMAANFPQLSRRRLYCHAWRQWSEDFRRSRRLSRCLRFA